MLAKKKNESYTLENLTVKMCMCLKKVHIHQPLGLVLSSTVLANDLTISKKLGSSQVLDRMRFPRHFVTGTELYEVRH